MDIAATPQKFDGARLRTLRTEKKWSQAELGRRIGAHVTSISDWERGDNAPSGRHVVGLAREFGVQADHFYGDSDDKEEALVDVDLNAVLMAAVDAVRPHWPAIKKALEAA